MTLEQRGACGVLWSAEDYLANKSWGGDNSRRYHIKPNEWMKNTLEAMTILKDCISKIRLEAVCNTAK